MNEKGGFEMLINAAIVVLWLTFQNAVLNAANKPKYEEPPKGEAAIVRVYYLLDGPKRYGYETGELMFVDVKGQVTKRLLIPKRQETRTGKKTVTTEINVITSANKKYAVIVTETIRREYVKMFPEGALVDVEVKSDFAIYDVKGKEILRRTNVDYQPMDVSDNGLIICKREALPSEEVADVKVVNPQTAKVLVLALNGETLFEDGKWIVTYQCCYISPRGIWIAYSRYDMAAPEGRILRLVRLCDKKEFLVDTNMIAGKFWRDLEIQDNGGVVFIEHLYDEKISFQQKYAEYLHGGKMERREWREIYRKKVYYPGQGKCLDLGMSIVSHE